MGLVVEELAYADFNMANAAIPALLMSSLIARHARDEIRRAWLPPLVGGDTYAALGLTEPGCGSDVTAIRTTATATADGYILRGEKTSVTMLAHASAIIVVAQTVRDGSPAGVSAFLVPLDSPGIAKSPISDPGWLPMGRGVLHLDDVQVPARNLLGGEGVAFRTVLTPSARRWRGSRACRSPSPSTPTKSFGYLNDDERTEAMFRGDGWYYSGDLGSLDADGYLAITGRSKDLIIRGGQNISPLEIEQIIARHDAISEVAVVGVPDPVFGERVCACVVLLPDRTGLTLDELVDYMRTQDIAPFKLPERLEVFAELPKTAGGKLSKVTVRSARATRPDRDPRRLRETRFRARGGRRQGLAGLDGLRQAGY